jgi:glycosyltransferase involved in cell wall biosynthesis
VHILLIHQVFVRPEDPGGTRHYEFARQFVRNGHRVTILTGARSYLTGERLESPRRQVLQQNMEIVRCWTIGGRHRGAAWRTIGFLTFALSALWEGLRTPQVDVVWGTTPPLFQAWTAWMLARLRQTGWLMEVRDLWPEFAVQVGVLRNTFLIWISRWLERFLYRRADQLVTNSPGFRSYLVKAGADEQKLALVPNGVDIGSFNSVAEGDLLRSSGDLQGSFVALYAGAHGKANDLWQVLEAAELLQDNSRIAFVLLGDGDEKQALMDKANASGLSNVHFRSAIGKAQIPAILQEADCGIAVLQPLPMFTTTYPNKVFDYMAAGIPVVLAINGVIRTVMEQAEGGIFAEPGDAAAMAKAIRRLADDPELAKRMGENGRMHAEAHFDRPKLAAEMEALLQSVSRVSR